MNNLKKLFGPRALATTVASGLLVGSALAVVTTSYVVWAISGFAQTGFCPSTDQNWSYPPTYGKLCAANGPGGVGNYYWCCISGDRCGTITSGIACHDPGGTKDFVPCWAGGGLEAFCYHDEQE
jgi:hypothetical protein